MHEQEDDPFRSRWNLSRDLDAIAVRQRFWRWKHATERQATKANAQLVQCLPAVGD